MANGQDFETKWNSLDGTDKNILGQVALLARSWRTEGRCVTAHFELSRAS